MIQGTLIPVQDWNEVAQVVKRRRMEMKLSQRAAAIAADVSPTTWGSLEKHGRPVEPATAMRISEALGWSMDGIERILHDDPPLTPKEAIAEARAWVNEAVEDFERFGGGAEVSSAYAAARRKLTELERRYGEPAPTETVDEETTEGFRETILRSFRAGIHEQVDKLSFDELWGVATAISWLRGRSESGMDGPAIRAARLHEYSRAFAPSLDDLMWNTPSLDELDEIARGQWSSARAAWQAATAELGDQLTEVVEAVPATGTRDRLDGLLRRYVIHQSAGSGKSAAVIGALDPEDHAYAASRSGELTEDPTEGASEIRPRGLSPIEQDDT